MNRLLRHSCRKQSKRLRAAAESMAISGRDPWEECVYVCVSGRGTEVGPACQVWGNEKHVSHGLLGVPSSGWKKGVAGWDWRICLMRC